MTPDDQSPPGIVGASAVDLWEALSSVLSEGVVVADREGRIVRINPTVCRWLATRPEACVGRPVLELLQVAGEWSTASVLTDRRSEVEGRLVGADGEARLVRVRRRSFEQGEVFVVEDRTLERRTAHRLAYADRLANGGALAEALLVPALTDWPAVERGDREATAEAGRRIRDALGLLSDPWTQPATCEVSGVVAAVVAATGHPSGVRLRSVVAPGLRVALQAVLLRQVLGNLVANAVRAVGDSGEVEVRATSAGGWIELRISDDGPGPSHDAEVVFRPYFTTEPGALGLGLSVVRDIVAAAGGVVSLVASGQTWVTLRLPAVAGSPAAQVRPRVLAVDPEPAVVRLLSRVLEEEGLEVVGATDPEQALRLVRSGEGFDAVLCGLELPEVDGVALARCLVDVDPRLGGRLGLLAGSEARLDLHRRRGGLEPGLCKPIEPGQIRALVRSLLKA